LRRLMTNISFRNRFINRFADELNSRFLFDNVSTHIQDVSDVISSEIPAHYNRWSGAVNSWSENINNLKVYAANRPYHVKQHIRNKFQLATIQKIIIENDDIDGGFVQLNNHLKIESTRWLGDYFEGVPITLKAIPEYGFKFSHWSGAVSSTESEIEIDLNSTTTVKAHFVESTNTPKRVIITEINYNSGDIVKPGDWVELYNPNSFMLDISGWALKDDDDTHIFNIPTGTTIAPEGFIVLARNSLDFSAAFPDVTNFVGDFGFGLSSTGDAVRIYDLNSDLQDEVYYRSSSPWPECANGTGATLELLLVSLDNSLPESWTCANNAGSPGKPGISLTSYEDLSNPALSIYPNPLDDYLYIEGLTPKSIMGIYDLNGRVLMQGEASGVINVSSLKAGSYILKIKSNYSESSFMLIKQ
ncbi:MAG: lamin tail domain-containing protein, partial [Bacteroidota bacterium]